MTFWGLLLHIIIKLKVRIKIWRATINCFQTYWWRSSKNVRRIKINIRSRGPVINTVAERYNGGGHKLASGARVSTMEEVDCLIDDLDNTCLNYINNQD